MKSAFIILLTIVFSSCGAPTVELEKTEMEQHNDLTERAIDVSSAKTETDSAEPTPEPPKKVTERFKFGTRGAFCVQVESWKTPDGNANAVARWKRKGFENAYSAIYPDEKTGEVWYRVRLGKFRNFREALAAAKAVSETYNVKAWADNTREEIPIQ
jgi:cell division septation protein DedD